MPMNVRIACLFEGLEMWRCLDLLKSLCKHGLPAGNIFEYAALQIQKYERKLKNEDLKKKLEERAKEALVKYTP